MSINADRASGLFFVLFGALLHFWVIPTFVDSSEGSWVKPDAIPNAVAVIMSIGGCILFIKPTQHQTQDAQTFLRAGIYFAILVSGLWGIFKFGFVYCAPLLALTLMLTIGEKRVRWLCVGVIATPTVIWLLMDVILERGLH